VLLKLREGTVMQVCGLANPPALCVPGSLLHLWSLRGFCLIDKLEDTYLSTNCSTIASAEASLVIRKQRTNERIMKERCQCELSGLDSLKRLGTMVPSRGVVGTVLISPWWRQHTRRNRGPSGRAVYGMGCASRGVRPTVCCCKPDHAQSAS